jgi:biopolymer transport protein ExbD
MRVIADDTEVAKSLNLPLTPMIDVFMNLLCFFLIAGHFKEVEREMAANLPKLGPPPFQPARPDRELWIRIRNGGDTEHPSARIIVGDRSLTRWEDVEATLGRYAQIPMAREDTVILAPELDAEHGWVMRVLGILQELQFRSINFKR